jgi:hypothetical protein
MTGFWDEKETNVVAMTTAPYAPPTAAQPEMSASQALPSEHDLKKELLGRIQSSMAGLPVPPSIFDNMSETELRAMEQSAPILARDVAAAARGEQVSTTIPGAQSAIDAIKRQHDEAQSFQHAAMGTIGVPLTGATGAGLYSTAGLFGPSGQEEQPKTIFDTRVDEKKVNEGKGMFDMFTGIMGETNKTLEGLFARLSDHSKTAINDIKGSFQGFLAKAGIGHHEQGTEHSLALLGGIPAPTLGGKQQTIVQGMPSAGAGGRQLGGGIM